MDEKIKEIRDDVSENSQRTTALEGTVAIQGSTFNRFLKIDWPEFRESMGSSMGDLHSKMDKLIDKQISAETKSQLNEQGQTLRREGLESRLQEVEVAQKEQSKLNWKLFASGAGGGGVIAGIFEGLKLLLN